MQYGYPGGYGPMAGGLWRKGGVLVMHKSAQLPDVCVKSGEPSVGRLKRNLQWFHPAIYLTLLVAILLYAILVAVLSKRATIYIGLSEKWFKKRRQALIIGWVSALIGVLLFVGSFVLAAQEAPLWGLVMLVGIFVFLAAIIYGSYAARMVTAQKIDDQYVWLKGVHPDVLAKLPEWPYPT